MGPWDVLWHRHARPLISYTRGGGRRKCVLSTFDDGSSPAASPNRRSCLESARTLARQRPAWVRQTPGPRAVVSSLDTRESRQRASVRSSFMHHGSCTHAIMRTGNDAEKGLDVGRAKNPVPGHGGDVFGGGHLGRDQEVAGVAGCSCRARRGRAARSATYLSTG